MATPSQSQPPKDKPIPAPAKTIKTKGGSRLDLRGEKTKVIDWRRVIVGDTIKVRRTTAHEVIMQGRISNLEPQFRIFTIDGESTARFSEWEIIELRPRK